MTAKRIVPTIAALSALVVTLTLTPGAAANNFGSSGRHGTGGTTNGVWLTGNRIWNVAMRDLGSAYVTGVRQAVNEEYGRTRLDVAAVVSDVCDDAGHDACVFDANYGDNGFSGWNACAGLTRGSHPNQECTLDWVRINTTYSPPAKRIACHELGHTVGLRHTTAGGSCMKTTGAGGTSSTLRAHDRRHINDHYGR